MKFNFKKIVSVIATTVMLGSTIAFAAAAYPAPFVNGGAADAALVVGANAAATDIAAATDLGASLDAGVTATTGMSGEGDKYLLEKASTKLHLGSGFVDVVSATVNSDKLPTLLKDGKYLDTNNDEFSYTQKITLGNSSVTMFQDNDYKDLDNNPTVGIRLASGANVLNYTLSMSDQPTITNTPTTDLPIMGKQYYVLTATNSTMTLLDSAEKVTLAEGETKTVTIGDKTYECSIAFIGATTVKLTVNGQTTNSLAKSETYKLSDGTYVGIRDISVQDYAGGIKQVEFGIGSGKLKLTSGSDIQINDDSIPRLTANITYTTDSKLTSITLTWKADGDLFVAPGVDAVMPGFKSVKLVWDSFVTPTSEAIKVVKGGDDYMMLENFPLKTSTEDIYLAYTNDSLNYTGIGKDANNMLRTTNDTNMTFDTDTDAYFVASYANTRDSESYLMRVTSFKAEGTPAVNKTTLEYKKDGAWTSFGTDKKPGDTATVGSVTLDVGAINYNEKSVVLGLEASESFNKLYSKEGAQIQLPYNNGVNTTITNIIRINDSGAGGPCGNLSATYYPTGFLGPYTLTDSIQLSNPNVTQCFKNSWDLSVLEEDKDGNVAKGDNVNVTFGFNSATTKQVEVTAVTGGDGTSTEIGDSKIWRNFIYSPLATEILFDKSGDQYSTNLIYHGGESMAKVYITAPTITSGAAKILVVKDSETSSVSGNNLIVVGGACVNKAAAMIVNGADTALCGDAWAAKTGAGAGKYLIQVAASPYNAGKIAMLVAGYDAADTTTAVAKVKEGAIDTTKNSATVYPLATA